MDETLKVYDTVFVTIYDSTLVPIHDTIYVSSEGIGGVDELNAKVYAAYGQIVVEGAEGNTVTLYDINGRVLATKRDEYAPLRFDAPASGAYLIRIGHYPAKKVVLRR